MEWSRVGGMLVFEIEMLKRITFVHCFRFPHKQNAHSLLVRSVTFSCGLIPSSLRTSTVSSEAGLGTGAVLTPSRKQKNVAGLIPEAVAFPSL